MVRHLDFYELAIILRSYVDAKWNEQDRIVFPCFAGESRVLFSDMVVKVNHRYKPQDRFLVISGT